MLNVSKLLWCLGRDLSLDISLVLYVKKRFSCEGVSFLTKVLPKILSGILRSIELGSLESFCKDPSLSRYLSNKPCGRGPFAGILSGLFNPDGSTKPDLDAVSLYQLKFLCHYFYKLALGFTADQIHDAEAKFVKEDNIQFDYAFAEELRKSFETNYSKLCGKPHYYFLNNYLPRHGPGTFSDSQSYPHPFYVYKDVAFDLKDWCFPRMFGNTRSGVASNISSPKFSELLFVPKDSRGPRTIVREPMRNLFFQMSFFDGLKTFLEDSVGSIHFTDQEIMRKLARQSSIDRGYATIDISSASDSLSFALCNTVYRNFSAYQYFKRFRTSYVKLPSGDLLKLKKLSGMGSGFTFPLMALTLHHTIVYSISRRFRVPYHQIQKLVHIYGDDIIVPTRYLSLSVNSLAKIGFKVNTEKSFSASHFRESCGGDFYDGNDVTTTKLRMANSGPYFKGRNNLCFKHNTSFLLELCSHTHELALHGFSILTEYYYSVIEKTRGVGRLPFGKPGSISGLFRHGDVKLTCDNAGNYHTVRMMVVDVAKQKRQYYNPHIQIARSLRRAKGNTQRVNQIGFFDEERVSVPRRLKLRWRRVSLFQLAGPA